MHIKDLLLTNADLCCRRKTFFKQKDRSRMTFTDPFPVEHKFLDVNGIR